MLRVVFTGVFVLGVANYFVGFKSDSSSSNLKNIAHVLPLPCSIPLTPPSYTSVFRAYEGTKLEVQTCMLQSYHAFWPSAAVWPGGSNVVVVWDGESERDHQAAEETKTKHLGWPHIHHLFEDMPAGGEFPESAFHRGWGYDRQQYSNMVIDLLLQQANLTSEYIGIGDTDSPLVAPVLPDALFHFNEAEGKWIPRVIGYNGCCTGWHAGNKFAFGENTSSVGEFMIVIGFPIVVKADHLKDLRKTIVRNVLGMDLVEDLLVGGLFEDAFTKILQSGFLYSQFDLIMHFMWENHRDEYHWILRDQERVHHPAFSKRMSNHPDVLAMDLEDKIIPHIGLMKHQCRTWEPFYRSFVCLASGGWDFEGCSLETKNDNKTLIEELFVDWEISKMRGNKERPGTEWLESGNDYIMRAQKCTEANFVWMRGDI